MLLVSAFFLVFPAEGVEPTRCPLELGGVLWLMCESHIVLESNNSVLFAPEALCDIGSHTYALVVGKLHDPPRVPYIVLF